jgi:hypothetical protein
MKKSDEEKLAIYGVVVVVCLILFAGGVGYIAVFSPLLNNGIYLSPGDSFDTECINGQKVNCDFNNQVLDELLCSC